MWENRDMFAHETHSSRIRGAQPPKHQIIINAQHTECEASNEFVFISSKRRDNEQGGS